MIPLDARGQDDSDGTLKVAERPSGGSLGSKIEKSIFLKNENFDQKKVSFSKGHILGSGGHRISRLT